MSSHIEFDDDIPILIYDKPASAIHTPQLKKYPNSTFIDWYVETAKPTVSSYKKWAAILIMAISSGYVVTIINLTAVWVNDLRKGICVGKLDQWSLLNPYLTCPVDNWQDWLEILVNSNKFFASALINFPLYVILGSITAFLAVFVSQKLLYIQQSGIPEVKEIIQGFNYDLQGYLGLKVLGFKMIGLSLVVASGFWLGKEGPFVHVCCCIINLAFNFIFRDSDKNEAVRRELLSAATATGIALAFNSPIGGVLFVLECIPSFFFPTKIMWNSFVSSTVGLVVLVGVKVFTEGQNFDEEALFSVEFGNVSWLILELIPFIGLGILGGVYGSLFIRIYSEVTSMRKTIQLKMCSLVKVSPERGNYVEILTIFFVTCLLNFPVAMTRLPLDAFLKSLFTNCPAEAGDDDSRNSANFMCSASSVITSIRLLYIGIQAFLLTAYTFGTILPGGVLMPSLVIGAVCGRFIGIIAQGIQTGLFGSWDTCTHNSCNVSPAAYAVIGAGAFMTGITKLTMCVVVILFELSGAVSYVLPIMIAVMVLKFTSDHFCNENIYDAWLKYQFNKSKDTVYKNGFNEGKGNGLCNYSTSTTRIRNKLPEISVSKVMIPTRKMRCLYLIPDEPMTVQSLMSFLVDDVHEGYPLLASPKHLLSIGYIHKQKLYDQLQQHSVDSQTRLSFEVNDLPNEVLSLQIRHEQAHGDSSLKLELEPEKPFIIMNDQAWLSLVIDTFEKMYLNYLIILDSKAQSSQVMAGFVDRFLLGQLIDEEFESTKDELVEFREFDIEAVESEAPLLRETLARERESIELIT